MQSLNRGAGACLPPSPACSLMEHKIMLPPSARGNVSWIAPAGSYTIADKVIEVEFGGQKKVSGSWWQAAAWQRFAARRTAARCPPCCTTPAPHSCLSGGPRCSQVW